MHAKVEIYKWFREMQGWNRMDFLCSLIHLCNAFELRFIGSCIEDLAQTDYNTLRDQELKANSSENLEQFVSKDPPVDEFRCHVSVCLSLLQSSNYKVASQLATLLEDKLEELNLQHLMQAGMDAEVEQWMLMLTLAAYHPAFSFEKRLSFKSRLTDYEILNKKEKKGSQCRRRHRCSQTQHADYDEPQWNSELDHDPYRRYGVYQPRGYNIHYPSPSPAIMDPYYGKVPLGSVPEGCSNRLMLNTRPSTFPSPLIPPSGVGDANFIEKPFNSNPMQNLDFVGYANSQKDDRTMVAAGPSYAWGESATNFMKPHQHFPQSVEYTTKSHQSTVPQSHMCSNGTTFPSVVTTTAITQSTSQMTKSANEYTWGSGYRNASSKPHRLVTFTNSDGNQSGKISRPYHEIRNQRSKTRNRSQSGDNSGKPTWRHSNNGHFDGPGQVLRPSTSAPVLSEGNEKLYPSSSNFIHDNMNKDDGNAVKTAEEQPVQLKPTHVAVKAIPKNKREEYRHGGGGTKFSLKITWNDGVTSECEHTVEELVKFYKQVTGKIGKNAINTDFLTTQNNQIQERRKKLELIFNEIVSSTANGSNIDDFMSFFKYNSLPNNSLPLKKRKFRQGSKPRVLADDSTSSSSNASPPLVNSNSRSRLLTSNSRPLPSVSPLSTTGGVSASSVLSSPNSTANVSSTSRNEDDADSDVRNDPYLKLYYWLQDRKLAHLYTHLKKFTFDQFSKLDPAEIDSHENLTIEEKKILIEEIASIGTERDFDDVGLDMGVLSLSGKDTASNSDALSDASKTMDIKAILDEDENSGSNRSPPVALEMPNTETPITASNSCFSFEFDPSTATVDDDKVKNSQFELHTDKGQIFYYSADDRHQSEPISRSVSQTNITPSVDNPQVPGHPLYYSSRSAPPFPPTFNPNAPVLLAYSLPPIPQTNPVFTNAPTMTSPTQGVKPVQFTYTVNTTQPGAAFPAPSIYPIHSMTSPIGDNVPIPPVVYVKSDQDGRSPSSSSDADSNKVQDPPVSNRSGIGPSYFYHPDPKRIHYTIPQKQWVSHHPLAPTYSDPTPYKDDYPDRPGSNLPFYALNGYTDPKNYSAPLYDYGVLRTTRNFSGDEPKRSSLSSCYNCGRTGHDATTCTDPNAVEVLGTEFQLKMSQSNNRTANE